MVCDACLNHYKPDDPTLSNKNASGQKIFESYVFTCPSCGGELLTTDEHDAVGFCPFCGGASMLFDRVHEQWEPDAIIPFQITKEQCKELYLAEARKSSFTAKEYCDPSLIDGFRGIYMPYWCYQAVMKGDFKLSFGRREGNSANEYVVTGTVNQKITGYGHDASESFDDRISEAIAPFDPHGHKPFAPGYLTGFYAEIGDVDARSYEGKATSILRKGAAQLLLSDKKVLEGTRGGAVVVHEGQSTLPLEIKDSQRVLYPVWFLSYRNKDKVTYAAVNGQTGKVCADLPVSPKKILTSIFLAGALIAGILCFLPSAKANFSLFVTSALSALGLIILRKTFKNTVNKSTGLIDTEEAERFIKRDRWRVVLLILCIAAGVAVAVMDLAFNWITYLCCLVQAGVLFYCMITHIRFQAEIAKRRPPQFEKKGAEYDES